MAAQPDCTDFASDSSWEFRRSTLKKNPVTTTMLEKTKDYSKPKSARGINNSCHNCIYLFISNQLKVSHHCKMKGNKYSTAFSVAYIGKGLQKCRTNIGAKLPLPITLNTIKLWTTEIVLLWWGVWGWLSFRWISGACSELVAEWAIQDSPGRKPVRSHREWGWISPLSRTKYSQRWHKFQLLDEQSWV